MTVVIQIGNSDNNLTQAEWSNFVGECSDSVRWYSSEVHFSGGSAYDSPWQNACWVCEVPEEKKQPLIGCLRGMAKHYRQDSIALTIGETQFIRAE